MKNLLTPMVLCLILLASTAAFAQTAKQNTIKSKTMNTYVIEREIPNAGQLSAAELQGISQKSCAVIEALGPEIEWIHSYVTDNKIFCIYKATNEEILRTHAMKGGFPINAIHPLSTVISPETATATLAEIK